MLDYIKDRLLEGSTVRGIIWCIGAFGVYTLSPEQAQAVTALVMALAGAHGVTIPDRMLKGK